MTRLLRSLLCGLVLRGAACGQAPQINKVDPPNWWVNLPAPMLLIHGENLNEVVIHLVAPGVKVTRQLTSPHGHWLFVWLDTARASPETIKIVARNSAGSASYNFPLTKRQLGDKQFQGFSPADVMY